MARAVIMEDDNATRMLIAAVLKKDGHEVFEADNGADGVRLVAQHAPDLVISDVQMPQMDGFAALAAIRAEEASANTPVILLTSLADREHMREGMNSGADDYLTKPFKALELREAVDAQLRRSATRVALQSLATEHALDAQRADAPVTAPTAAALPPDVTHQQATVLHVQISSYAAMTQRLSSMEMAEVVRKFYQHTHAVLSTFAIQNVDMDSTGMTLLFTEAKDAMSVTHGVRAVKAAFALVEAGKRTNQYAQTLFAGRDVPAFEVKVALNSGPVTVIQVLSPSGQPTSVMAGAAIMGVHALQTNGGSASWLVGATTASLRTVTGAVRVGTRAMLQSTNGQAPMDAGEIAAILG
jgi:DNA-binding response OmpR family regulator